MTFLSQTADDRDDVRWIRHTRTRGEGGEKLPSEPDPIVLDFDQSIVFEIREQPPKPFLTVLATVIDAHARTEFRKREFVVLR